MIGHSFINSSMYVYIHFNTYSKSTSVQISVKINSFQQIEILTVGRTNNCPLEEYHFPLIIHTVVGSQLMLTCGQLILRDRVSQFCGVLSTGLVISGPIYTHLFCELSFSLGVMMGEPTGEDTSPYVSLTPWTKGAFLGKIFLTHSGSVWIHCTVKLFKLPINCWFSKERKILKN